MSTLNRKKPFGEVYGIGVSWRYEQDGKRFDHEGVEIGAKPAEGGAASTVVTINGQQVNLAGMDAPALREIALKLELSPHPNTGAPKLVEAIVAALAKPAEGGAVDQVGAQLNS